MPAWLTQVVFPLISVVALLAAAVFKSEVRSLREAVGRLEKELGGLREGPEGLPRLRDVEARLRAAEVQVESHPQEHEILSRLSAVEATLKSGPERHELASRLSAVEAKLESGLDRQDLESRLTEVEARLDYGLGLDERVELAVLRLSIRGNVVAILGQNPGERDTEDER